MTFLGYILCILVGVIIGALIMGLLVASKDDSDRGGYQ